MNRPRFVSHPRFNNYLCCEDGRIYSRSSDRFLDPKPQNNGYKTLSIGPSGKQKKHAFHRFIMEAFYGDSEFHVNHKNGIKTDNRLCNLEYVSHKENIRHACDNNLIKFKRGESSHKAKYQEETVLAAITLLNTGKTAKEIERTGLITYGALQGVISGKSWKHMNQYIDKRLTK